MGCAPRLLLGTHCYADDTQLYMSFSPGQNNKNSFVLALEQCITHVHTWLLQNNLLLNDKKTEFLICATPKQMSKLHIESIKVVMSNISPSTSVRNLGIWFDSHLTFDKHIAEVCKNAFYYLFNIRHIRKYLTRDCTEKIIHAFVTSRLDYCNSLFFGFA